MAQGAEEPPFLRVGTEVSAKYRGAFCEASIKTVKKHVKCKIQYKDNTTATLTDDVVKGNLKIGSDVVVKTPDGRSMEGVIIKLTDASTYTVVFDDGDERTLRRTSLCLKGGRHFNESETLDHLPLTDPENFGTPVIQNGKKRKKRTPSAQQPSFEDGDSEKEEDSPAPSKKKCLYNDSIMGKVVIVERGSRRKSHWFPALGVSPNQDNLVHIKSKDHCLVRSFKDGNYHVINIRDTKEFSKDQEPVSSALKSDSRTNKPGIERALAYLDTGRVPTTWEGSKFEVIIYEDTDEDTKKPAVKTSKMASSDDDNDHDESSDDDSGKEAFVEKLQAFMEKQGTPIIRNPVLGNQDLDLYKLYLLVIEAGGMEEVTRKQEWRSIYAKMGIAIMPPSASHHIKMAYKKYLHPYELHELSCRTGKDNCEEKSTSSNKKDKPALGRTRLERNSKASPKLQEKPANEKRSKPVSNEMAEKTNNAKPLNSKGRRASTPNKPASSPKPPPQASTPPPPSKPNKLPLSNSYNTPPSKQVTTPTGKSKALYSRQSSRTSTPDNHKESMHNSPVENDDHSRNGSEVKNVLKQDADDDRQSYKDSIESDIDVDEDVTSPYSEPSVDVVNSPGCMSDTSESRSDTRSECGTDEAFDFTLGDKIQVKYGRGRNRRIYEAKIVTVDPDADEGLLYLIHYTGWNIRYDEWISPDRILGKSNRSSKKKGPAVKELLKNKIPPKPPGKQFMRLPSKRGTKSPSPASPGNKSTDSKSSHSNGNKASQPIQQPDSPSSGKQPPKNGTYTRRTRSDRNSFSSNGLDEVVKSPPTKRRQKSLTPEPPEEPKPVENTEKIENPSTLSNDESDKTKNSNSETTNPTIKEQDSIKTEKPDSDDDDDDNNDKKIEPTSSELSTSNNKIPNLNSKLRPWAKLPPNGLTMYSSSESGSPEHSASENDPEPANKKVKVEKEIDQEELEKLLCAEVVGKEPIAAPHTQGSSSSDSQGREEDSTEEERQKSSSPDDSSEQKPGNSTTETSEETRSNSTETESSKEEKTSTSTQEETKPEKKDSDHRGKRHRKKKERKRQRQHSINENSNDGCSSPTSKSSPPRTKLCFSADLESIKSMEDGSERIRLLQLKINEMRKLYGSLKAEVASIDRRKKKLKKKREENASSTDNKSPNCVASSPATVECR